MKAKTMPTGGTVGKNGNDVGRCDVSKNKYSTKRPTAQALHNPNSLKAWAMRYALAGWRVLPLVPGGKNPLTSSGVHDATDDPETIAEWWNRWPSANIGLALGNDLVALDLDPRNGGNLAHLAELDLDSSKTATARTAGGGWHVVYQKPASMAFVSHVPRLPGLDVLTGARYIVAAPSIVAGNVYRWERDPLDYPPARMPQHVAERLQERPRTPQDAPQAAGAGNPGQWTLQDVEAMLSVLDPWQDGYDYWIATGMAIHSEWPGADGLAVWERWADGKPGECERKWQSFRKAGVTLGTLVYLARQNGWQSTRPADPEDHEHGIPPQWRITAEDWNSCPLCAALYTEEFSDGSVRTFHRFCRQKTCRVYRKVKARRVLSPVFRWAGVRSEVVSGDDWRRWREDARQRLGDKWRGLPVGEDSYLAIYESPDGEDLDDVLEMAAAAVLEKPKGRNVSAPRQRRKTATPGPSPKERPRSVRPLLVSRFTHRRRILGILDRLNIEWERQRLGGWKTGALSDGQLIALETALVFGVPGAKPLNSAYGSTVKLDNATTPGDWPEPLPRTEREYRLMCVRDRVPIRMEVPK